tara:strand:+ start:104 stop:697 length:594 start_codon:yes stop_codon:yes gene_type:complete
MKYLKNFSLLFLIFIISKTFSANANNIYFINSTANNLTEIDQYSLKNFLDMKSLNLISDFKNINSIFDQADIYEEIAQQNTNKKIIFVDKYYLESILFESDYFLLSCSRDQIVCNEKKIITYNQMFYPLINILHKRLLNLYFDYYDQNLLLIFNNTNNDTLLRKYFTNNSFLFKDNNYCIAESLIQIEGCINEFIKN